MGERAHSAQETRGHARVRITIVLFVFDFIDVCRGFYFCDDNSPRLTLAPKFMLAARRPSNSASKEIRIFAQLLIVGLASFRRRFYLIGDIESSSFCIGKWVFRQANVPVGQYLGSKSVSGNSCDDFWFITIVIVVLLPGTPPVFIEPSTLQPLQLDEQISGDF